MPNQKRILPNKKVEHQHVSNSEMRLSHISEMVSEAQFHILAKLHECYCKEEKALHRIFSSSNGFFIRTAAFSKKKNLTLKLPGETYQQFAQIFAQESGKAFEKFLTSKSLGKHSLKICDQSKLHYLSRGRQVCALLDKLFQGYTSTRSSSFGIRCFLSLQISLRLKYALPKQLFHAQWDKNYANYPILALQKQYNVHLNSCNKKQNKNIKTLDT